MRVMTSDERNKTATQKKMQVAFLISTSDFKTVKLFDEMGFNFVTKM